MFRTIVSKTSVFPADRHTVFMYLQKLSTLQYIAFPYASFEPAEGDNDTVWKAGETSAYRFRLFGRVPFGTHVITVIHFDEEKGIYTRERNEHVPVWNHEIILEDLTGKRCRYTDRVEISAGWKTPFIWLWANAFYAHRQRKWVKLLERHLR